jgi:hypothetical protein
MTESNDLEKQYVYVVGADSGPVKIGYSRNPAQRLEGIRTAWVPDKVARSMLSFLYLIEGTRDLERELHTHFLRERVKGEWFYLGKPPVAALHVADVARRYALRRGDPEPVRVPPPPRFTPPPRGVGPTGASADFELFRGWIAAGFTEAQAMQLLTAVVARR